MGNFSKSTSKKQLSALTAGELNTRVQDIEEQIFRNQLQRRTGQLANTSIIKNLRKELARAKTYISQKAQG